MTKHDSKINDVLIMRLKSGEYDGTHIMKAWITITEQAKELVQLRNKNAKLRFANNEAKEYIESELGSVFITVCPSKPFNPKEHQAIRDLEQKADALDNFKIPEMSYTVFHKVGDALNEQAEELREQAKQLKG